MKSPLAHVSVVGDNAVPLSVVGEDVNLSVATRMRNPFGAFVIPLFYADIEARVLRLL